MEKSSYFIFTFIIEPETVTTRKEIKLCMRRSAGGLTNKSGQSSRGSLIIRGETEVVIW